MQQLAVLYLGVNELNLSIVNYTKNGYYVLDRSITEPLKLGIENSSNDDYIKSQRISETILILKSFRKIIDNRQIQDIECIASPEFNNVRNQIAFFDEIYKTVSLFFKIQSNEDIATLIHTAIINTFGITKGFVMQVGDVSSIILKYSRKVLLGFKILPVGALTLAELTSNITVPENKIEKMQEIFLSYLSNIDILKDIEEDCSFIGVGEIFEAVGKLARKSTRYPLDLAHNYILKEETFNSLFNLIKTLDLDKTKKLKGITEGRADLLAGGVSIINALKNVTKFKEVAISTHGLIDGTVIRYMTGLNIERPIFDVLGCSLSNINEFYGGVEAINNIYDLSVILYRQLRVLHKLNRNFAKVLRIAASMCMSGKRISFENYERNNFFVISHSDIFGVSHREILLAAFIASSQNINDFSLSEWVRYKDILDEEDIDAVKKLAIIIKLASMLNVTGSNSVKDISCDILGDTVILKTLVEKDASLEISQAMSIASDFKKVYGKNLQLL